MTGQIPYTPAGPVGQPRPAPPATPELDKRSKVIDSAEHKGVVAFLDWLTSEGIMLARWYEDEPHDGFLAEIGEDNNRLLARFNGLDADKIASEQDALLAYLREINSQ